MAGKTAKNPLDMRLSNSKLKTWRRCPKQYHYKYVLGLRSKQKAIPLERGTWIHALLEEHYNGGDWKAEHKKRCAGFDKLFVEEKDALGDIPGDCLRIMKSYLQRYRDEDKKYKVIATEMDEILELPNGLKFQFIIDLIVEDEQGVQWLWDHKTVGKFMDSDFMLLDAQLARYFWCAQQLGFDKMGGVMFNEILTKAPTVPELLKNGKLTTRQNLHTDAMTYMRAIKKHGLDPRDYETTLRRLMALGDDKFFRRTKMPRDTGMTKQLMMELVMGAREIQRAVDTNQFPRTPDKMCRMCEFMEPCIIELQGGDTSMLLKHKYDHNTKGRPKK